MALRGTPPDTDRAEPVLVRRASPSPDLPADVRRELAARLRARNDLDDGELAAIELVVSELVTNAICVARRSVVVRVCDQGDAVLVEVDDDGPGWPSIHRAGPDATSGRGLMIVDHLCDGCGAVEIDGSAKRVWASVPLPSRDP